ncbi:MAG TPA: glycosyltransferase family 39 protein, partial [Anaerolineae bacterium]|nr:glycosyltransferase family 39 protein [Anaerolineae bacterium]
MALAFFLRVYRLADKNIWWDEGWTIWLSQHDFAWIALRTASDEHPPLHYWLMHLWQDIFGSTGFSANAFSARFFSLVFGVLLVALVYRIGKEIGGARVGLLAALFLSLARFPVWWSQDIKNYTLSTFFAWAGVWFVWKWLFSKSNNRYLIGYVLGTTLALYSHYLAALVFLADNVFVAIVWITQWRASRASGDAVRRKRLALQWIAAQIAVLVLFAPWLYLYLRNGATWTAAPAFDFGLFVRLAATVLSLGVTTYIENYIWAVLGLFVVAGLSVGWIVESRELRVESHLVTPSPCHRVVPIRRPSSVVRPRSSLAFGALLSLLILLIPPALIYFLSLTPAALFAPKIQARYLLMVTPAFALLLALGVWFIARGIRWHYAPYAAAAVAVAILGAQLFTLRDYFQERYLRDEYVSLAQMINNFAHDDDAIVLNTDQEWPTFLFYLQRPLIWIGVPNGKAVDANTAQRVAAQALQRNGVWVVTIPDALAQDPQRLVEKNIAEHLPKQYEQTFGDKRLTLYANTIRNVKDAPPQTFSPQIIRNNVFNDHLKLIGADLPVREAFAGDVMRVVTYWQAQDLTTINLALQTSDGRDVARVSIPISIGAHERAQGDLQIPPNAQPQELRVIAQAHLNSIQIGTLRVLPRASDTNGASDAPLDARN